MNKNYLFISTFILLLFLFNCDKLSKEFTPAEISWIAEKGYSTENVEPLRAKGKLPAPEIKVDINGKKHWLALDLSQPYLILKETEFELQNFAPSRIVSIVNGSNEMLLEDGLIKNIRILGTDYDLTHCSLLKKGSQKLLTQGMVGRNFFKHKVLTLDFKNGVIAHTERNDIKPLDGEHKINFKFERNEYVKYPLLYCKGFIDSIEVLLNVNTTQRFSQISPELANRLSNNRSQEIVTVKNLKLNGIIIPNIKCQINSDLIYNSPVGNDILNLSVGLNVLKRYRFTIDMQQNCFYLAPPQSKTKSQTKTTQPSHPDSVKTQ